MVCAVKEALNPNLSYASVSMDAQKIYDGKFISSPIMLLLKKLKCIKLKTNIETT